jgi:integrase
MQNGCLMQAPRRRGPDVWEFRWREPGSDGRRIHRRVVVGTVEQFKNESRAVQAIVGLRREINSPVDRMTARLLTVAQLVEHYKQRELAPANEWKTHSTKEAYKGYLRKWIVPRWGTCTLSSIKPIEVESWLRRLRLSRASCAKIRNLMSVLFNHARRYDLFDRNPISLVRQSAKRQRIPEVLGVDEVRRLLRALDLRERTLVLIAAGTGLRMSELFGLKWKDVDFKSGQLSVTRSIVEQVVGPCKTEASQKPLPLDSHLAMALRRWRRETKFRAPEDWVFASPHTRGRLPFWGQRLMRYHIQPAARRVGIMKRFGWHTFRHTYSTLLRAAGVDIKVMQELLRHASSRVTMDTYTQAITSAKRQAQSSVVTLFTGKLTQVERAAN